MPDVRAAKRWPSTEVMKPPPVAALCTESFVAERCHQLGEDVGDFDEAEALLAWLQRQRITGERGRDDGEVLGEQRDDFVKLEHRARPAM